jgi:hypothetical protein
MISGIQLVGIILQIHVTGTVTHTWNPSYLGGREQENPSSKQKLVRPNLNQ